MSIFRCTEVWIPNRNHLCPIYDASKCSGDFITNCISGFKRTWRSSCRKWLCPESTTTTTVSTTSAYFISVSPMSDSDAAEVATKKAWEYFGMSMAVIITILVLLGCLCLLKRVRKF